MRPIPFRLGVLALFVALLPLAGCGGGGGAGGPPSKFPAGVTAQDLVAVEFEDAVTFDGRLQIVSTLGGGAYDVEGILTGIGASVDNLEWSPDHSLLAVVAYPDGAGETELFVVEPLTGVVHPVSGPSTADDYVDQIRWSPDSRHLAFNRSRSTGHNPVFAADADGSNLEEVSGPVVAGGNPSEFAWSPDSTRLALAMSADDANTEELYVVARDGTGRVKVSGATIDGGNLSQIQWAPDGTRIAYLGDRTLATVFELWWSPAAGPAASVRFHPALSAGRDVIDFDWAPDGSRIAFIADTTDEQFELFAALPDGSGFVTASGSLVGGGDVSTPFRWAPDSSRIAFTADRLTDGVVELFTTLPTGAGTPIHVSGTMVSGGEVQEFRWSPDASRLLYEADQELDGSQHLYVTLPTSAAAVRLSPKVSAGDSVNVPAWSPDSARVTFFFDRPSSPPEFIVAPLASAPVTLIPADPGIFQGLGPVFTPDGARLVSGFSPSVGEDDLRAWAIPTLSETILTIPPAKPASVRVTH